MTAIQPVHKQAEEYILSTLEVVTRHDHNLSNEQISKVIANTLHDAKLLRDHNDTEKIAIAVAEAMVNAGFTSGDK